MSPLSVQCDSCMFTPLARSVSNATLDLIMMAAWNLALESFPGEPIPVCSCRLYM